MHYNLPIKSGAKRHKQRERFHVFVPMRKSFPFAQFPRTRTVPIRSGLSGPKTAAFSKSASSCPRAADGDRPRSGLRRTANRPGSQRLSCPKTAAFSKSASSCPRAADGDRPRSGLRRTRTVRFAAGCLARRQRPFQKRFVLPTRCGRGRPRSGLRRTANRPGSQRVVLSEDSGLFQKRLALPRAADGDRPRAVRSARRRGYREIERCSMASPWGHGPNKPWLDCSRCNAGLQLVLGVAHECVQ